MINLTNLQHHISQNLFRIIPNLRFLQKLPNNHRRYRLILPQFNIRIPLGTTHDQLETLIQNNENILVVNIVIDNVLVHAVDDGLDYGLGVVRTGDRVVFADYGKHELGVF